MTPNHSPESTDHLDSLLSAFFKAQIERPWPPAPVPAAEPSELVAVRAEESVRSAPPFVQDGAARARFTLAASVALLIGTGWFLADGARSGAPTGGLAVPGAGVKFLPDSGADGRDHPSLKKIGENKAKGDADGAKQDSGIRFD